MRRVVVAHQGGWDELLVVGAPVVIFAFLLWLARTRAERELEDDGARELEDDGARELEDDGAQVDDAPRDV